MIERHISCRIKTNEFVASLVLETVTALVPRDSCANRPFRGNRNCISLCLTNGFQFFLLPPPIQSSNKHKQSFCKSCSSFRNPEIALNTHRYLKYTQSSEYFTRYGSYCIKARSLKTVFILYNSITIFTAPLSSFDRQIKI